jgi:hypothetical protein
MFKPIALLTTLSLSLNQAVAPSLSRFGSVGRALQESEITQIGQLGKGKAPWLLYGESTMITGVFRAHLYLEPNTVRNRLWRGQLLSLEADWPPTVPTRSSWRIRLAQAYAYVVPPDGQAGRITGDLDVNWPFAVVGEFDDEALLSLVDFIRSNPPIPGVPANAAPRNVDGTKPITSVGRKEDRVLVILRTGVLQGLEVTLARANGNWEVTAFGMWIV